MSRRPALLTQADIARTIRAAKQAGAESVDIRLPNGGMMRVRLSPNLTPSDDLEAEAAREIVL